LQTSSSYYTPSFWNALAGSDLLKYG
jgi:hypothetical protein